MVKFISKSELDSLKSDNKISHNAGEIYPQIFSTDSHNEFNENLKIEAGIIWLGGYMLNNKLFKKEKCPICGEKELIPYKAIGSVLSGSHTIQFWCKNCDEKFVTNDYPEYFRKITQYIIENRKKFNSEQELDNCTSAPLSAEFVKSN